MESILKTLVKLSGLVLLIRDINTILSKVPQLLEMVECAMVTELSKKLRQMRDIFIGPSNADMLIFMQKKQKKSKRPLALLTLFVLISDTFKKTYYKRK